METFDSLGEDDVPTEEKDDQSSGPGFWLLNLLDLFPGPSTTLSLSPPPDDDGEEKY